LLALKWLDIWLLWVSGVSRYVHARIAVGRVSKRHPIAVIPPVAGLPGKRAA
jgi:hypothetical protein